MRTLREVSAKGEEGGLCTRLGVGHPQRCRCSQRLPVHEAGCRLWKDTVRLEGAVFIPLVHCAGGPVWINEEPAPSGTGIAEEQTVCAPCWQGLVFYFQREMPKSSGAIKPP